MAHPQVLSKATKKIRQGDPLSPYIGVLVMEYWSIIMDLTLVSGRISTIRGGPANYVTHIVFAVD